MANYFLKCDISGIQSFIFNVPSDGAARALKSRSVYVKNIADECLKRLRDFFNDETDNLRELYNGGGNFYLESSTDKTENEISKFIETIETQYQKQDIFPYISFIKQDGENISELLDKVNKKIQKAKLQRPVCFDLLDAKPVKIDEVDIQAIEGINGQVPDGDFEYIAKKSEGDSKLAALKLDVDNLGSLFKDRTEEDYRKLSNALKDFFDGKLLQLIKDLGMQQTIYVVFSGGDDCFLIGTWEKVFELAIALRIKFNDFQRALKKKINSLPDSPITFSAGMIVFQPHFPMIQLVNEVEDALSTSKRTKDKNCITVFGKTLHWNNFEKAQEVSKELKELISEKGESKSLLQIFRLTYPGNNEMPKPWQLKYYLKRNVNENNRRAVNKIFDDFSKSLMFRYMTLNRDKVENPDIYLVASRWAELLMK